MSRLALIVVLVAAAACGSSSDNPPPPQAPPPAAQASPSSNACNNSFKTQMEKQTTPPSMQIDAGKSYTATIKTARGSITVQLDAKAAPQTVNNFVYLAKNGFYNCLTFHRVEAGFVIQGGDPLGNGTGGPGYKLPDETNPAQWLRGSIGMASSPAGVNGSQFFILTGDATYLSQSGVYNHFGTVSAGMEVADRVQVGDEIQEIDIAES